MIPHRATASAATARERPRRHGPNGSRAPGFAHRTRLGPPEVREGFKSLEKEGAAVKPLNL